MKGKKWLIGLLSLACVTANSFGLVACGDNSAGKGTSAVVNVEFDANGDLLITFTDGTTQTVAMPEKECQSEGMESLHYQRIAGKDEYRVIGLGNISSLEIVVPATYNGLPVTEIDIRTYGDSHPLTRDITSIEIPETITSITDDILEDFPSLQCNEKNGLQYLGNKNNPYLYLVDTQSNKITSVTIENTCKILGERVFEGCSSLTSIEIPDGVTSIGDWTFGECTSLSSIEIPNSVISIGAAVFFECNSLTSIEFKGTVAEWNAIEKGEEWDYNVPVTEIVCVDGKFSL